MSFVGSLHSALSHQYDLPSSKTQKVTSETKIAYNSNSYADKVTISFEAQKIAELIAKERTQQYAPPSLFPNDLTSAIKPNGLLEDAEKYIVFHENLSADGEISARDIEALQGYVDIVMATNVLTKKT